MPRKPDPRCCRSCALWDIDAARDKAGRVRKAAYVRCLWESTEARPNSTLALEPRGGWINGYLGTDCPCWKERQP